MAITLRSNKREYSKYTPGLEQVDLTISGMTLSTSYRIALVRDDGFGDVVVRAITATGSPESHLLDLRGATADTSLGELAAERLGINYANVGLYHAEVRNTSGTVLARSSSFPVSALTVEEFKRSYLFGVPLWAEEVMQVVKQPLTVTGVTVGYIDPAMLKGPGALVFVETPPSLSWRGGPTVSLDTSVDEIQSYQLLTPEADAYIEVEIDPFLLPDEDTSETLVIDNWRMTDADLRRYLANAFEWVQQKIQVRLETTIVTTDPLTYGSYFDETAEAIGYERGGNRTIAVGSAKTRPLRKVLSLAGYYVDTKTITIPDTWITVEERGATIELIPISGSALVTPLTAAWGLAGSAIRSQREIQDFWHFTVISGLRSLEHDRYSVREAIAKKAAHHVLTDLSLGASGGRLNRSANREGVSESWGYGGQGAYGEKITQYAEWLKTDIPKLRQYYAGLSVVVL